MAQTVHKAALFKKWKLAPNTVNQRLAALRFFYIQIDCYLQDAVEMERVAFSRKQSYTSFLRNWAQQKWGAHRLEQVRMVAVEQSLRDLELASRTKVHIRNVMHVLFECAARWEFTQNNPITHVRQGGSRRTDPDILTPAEFQALLKAIADKRVRAMDSGRMPQTEP